jgi:hypothetical protein
MIINSRGRVSNVLRNSNVVNCPNTAFNNGGLFANTRNAERVAIGAGKPISSPNRAAVSIDTIATRPVIASLPPPFLRIVPRPRPRGKG